MAEAADVIVGEDDTFHQYCAASGAPGFSRGVVDPILTETEVSGFLVVSRDYGRVAVMMLPITEGP
jgi:hypothetical protein